MKVLLISPVPARDEAGGDITYTQTLVSHPPPGVEYETYDHAIDRGALSIHGTAQSLKKALSERSNVLGELGAALASKPINMLRRRRLLFNEPINFFHVRPGEYDLIHMHIFSAHFNALDCPLVISNGGALRHLYIDGRGYARHRIRRMESADRLLGRLLGADVSSEYLRQASAMAVLTETGTRELRRRRLMSPSRIHCVPVYQPSAPPQSVRRPAPDHIPRRVGFIAREFGLKGGPTVLEAWKIVQRARPDAELILAGSTPTPEMLAAPGNITWLPYIPREQLLSELIPSLDVFACPTLADYQPFILLEMMSRGVPTAGSTHGPFAQAMGPDAGLTSPKRDAPALAHNILTLLEPHANRRYSQGALRRFETYFTAEAVHPKLLACYQTALSNR